MFRVFFIAGCAKKTSWWLNHPFEKSDRQNGSIFPKDQGWKFQKYLSCHHLPRSSKGCVSWMMFGVPIQTPSLRVQTAPELENAGRKPPSPSHGFSRLLLPLPSRYSDPCLGPDQPEGCHWRVGSWLSLEWGFLRYRNCLTSWLLLLVPLKGGI